MKKLCHNIFLTEEGKTFFSAQNSSDDKRVIPVKNILPCQSIFVYIFALNLKKR